MVAISFLVTDRLRYVMIVSIPDTIRHQELERKLFLKKTYCEVLHLKLRAIIARERLHNNKQGVIAGAADKLLSSSCFRTYVPLVTVAVKNHCGPILSAL